MYAGTAYCYTHEQIERNRRGKVGQLMKQSKSRHLLYFAILTAFIVVAFAPFFFVENQQMLPLIEENGLYQTPTAVAFLLAAVFLGLAYLLDGNGNDFGKIVTQRNVFVLLLALVLFIGAGEELSWGQHMFGFEPPDAIAKHNRQGELNIHNLFAVAGRNADGSQKTGLASYLTISKLFSLFWFGFCVCIPLVASMWPSARQFLLRMNMPIVPLWIGMVFPLNYLLSKFVVAFTRASEHYVVEVKESNFAVMFFLFGAGLYIGLRQASKQALRE